MRDELHKEPSTIVPEEARNMKRLCLALIYPTLTTALMWILVSGLNFPCWMIENDLIKFAWPPNFIIYNHPAWHNYKNNDFCVFIFIRSLYSISMLLSIFLLLLRVNQTKQIVYLDNLNWIFWLMLIVGSLSSLISFGNEGATYQMSPHDSINILILKSFPEMLAFFVGFAGLLERTMVRIKVITNASREG